MIQKQTSFEVGEKVIRLKRNDDKRNYWASGVVVMVVPAGVSPYSMWLRWFKAKGVCKFKTLRDEDNVLIHKDRYIVQVEKGAKTLFYCPRVNTIARAD